MRALPFFSPPPLPLSLPRSPNPNPRSRPRPLRSLPVSTADPEVSVDADAARPALHRRLILLRHAESTALLDRSLRDHDRPLSKAGQSDAIAMSRKLQQLGWIPELILSSDATRTKETLQIMQEHVRKFSQAEVYFMPSFYSIAAMDGQTAEHLQKAICAWDIIGDGRKQPQCSLVLQ